MAHRGLILVECRMTVLNHARSAEVVAAEAEAVVVAADTRSRRTRRLFAHRLRISSLATLLVSAGVSGLSTAGDARGVTGGMTGGGGADLRCNEPAFERTACALHVLDAQLRLAQGRHLRGR